MTVSFGIGISKNGSMLTLIVLDSVGIPVIALGKYLLIPFPPTKESFFEACKLVFT